MVPGTRPPEVREGQRAFDRAFSEKLVRIAQAVEELQPAEPEPDLNEALERFETMIAPWVQSLTDQSLLTRVSGIRALIRQAVALAGNLSENCSWC